MDFAHILYKIFTTFSSDIYLEHENIKNICLIILIDKFILYYSFNGSNHTFYELFFLFIMDSMPTVKIFHPNVFD